MTEPSQPYSNLLHRSREIGLIDSACQLLSWDQETCMPPECLPFRAEQLAHLGGWTHRLFTKPEVGDWIKACEDHGFTPDSDEAANVREWRRAYDRKTKVPAELVEELQRAQSFAREAWIEARQKSEFPIFQPHLEKLLQLSLRMADCWGYEQSRYDALLESYEPGARAAALKKLFSELRPVIAELGRIAGERSARLPADMLRGQYLIAAQQAFNREVAEALGFDFKAGRIDTTAHPFCSGISPGDCRLTTRYNEADFTESLYGVLHEAGHGMYEQGIRREAHGTPLGSAASLGIHESQSRLWENHVGRSRTFWEHWLPRAAKHFPSLTRFTPEAMHAAVNRVEPSFIRVEADEVTYDLHIILRFEIETRLIEGALKVADVPHVWNEEFEKLMGLKVPNDALGCLQDIHWSFGNFGYFPTYTLGNLNASQLFHCASANLPDLQSQLGNGDYSSLLGWLRNKVHQHGQRFEPPQLMHSATGEATQARYHLDYLRRKFGEV
ncbi:MAG: carboxypeptidase M32 [Pedosphaera sp.]|nr:carboxypeptidase M32 [Pedosphaera sp.]